MLLLTSLQTYYPSVVTTGSWYLVDAPPGVLNLEVNTVCDVYSIGDQIGSTSNPQVKFTCPSVEGIYKFEYRVVYCGNLISYLLNVDYTGSIDASIEKVYSGSPCAVNAILVDVASSVQQFTLLWDDDEYVPTINGRLVITDACGHTSANDFSLQATNTTKVYTYLDIPITDYAGYISNIRLKNSLNTYNIDVSPTSPYVSYTGSPYMVVASNLYFSVAATNFLAYQTALQRIILNAIHSLTGAQSNMCPFGVAGPVTNKVQLVFYSKHNPTNGLFTGVDHLDARVLTYQSGASVTSFTGASPRRLFRDSSPITVSGVTACGNTISVTNTLITAPDQCTPGYFRYLDLPSNGSPYSFNVNYDTIDFGTFKVDTTACSASGIFTCPGNTLTLKAVTNPDCPNATYSWSTGATTKTIIPTTGTYTVTVNCDSCSDTASITI